VPRPVAPALHGACTSCERSLAYPSVYVSQRLYRYSRLSHEMLERACADAANAASSAAAMKTRDSRCLVMIFSDACRIPCRSTLVAIRAPDGPDPVDHELRRQPASAVDAAATEQRCVGRVDDRVDRRASWCPCRSRRFELGGPDRKSVT